MTEATEKAKRVADQGCFHWLSSPIRSGVMADHTFAGHFSGRRGR